MNLKSMLAQAKNWIKNDRLSLLRGIVVWRGKKSDTIYLTFDDGPHPEYTKMILDALSRHGVQATFFFLGKMMAQNMEIAMRTYVEGHTIGNHSYDHHLFSHPFSRKDFNGLEETDIIIQKIAGSKPSLIRPPYGEITLTLLSFSILKKQLIAMWSFDSRDSFVKTDLELIQDLQSVHGGDILLFHDDTLVTAKNIDTILTTLKKRGFRFSSLHSLLPED
jgi:peptidoglycan-N-acetylglucosamine deacetylase